MFKKSLVKPLLLGGLLGASGTAQAAYVELNIPGSESGFINNWEVEIYGGQVTYGNLDLEISFEMRWYDPDIGPGGQITGNDYFIAVDCQIGGCNSGLVSEYLRDFNYDSVNNVLSFSQITPASFDNCVLGENPFQNCAFNYQRPDVVLSFNTEGDGVQYDLRLMSTNAVPEATIWAMMIAGFGLVGAALRRREKEDARHTA